MRVAKPVMDISKGAGVVGNTLPALLSSTVVNTVPDWNATTAYTTGQEVVYGFYVWIAASPSTGEIPSDSNTANWTKKRASNYYAMFDGTTNNRTIYDGTNFVVEISAQGVNSLGFFSVYATSINVLMTDPIAGVVYNETLALNINSEGVTDGYTYFFLPIPEEGTTVDRVLLNLPPYPSSTIQITFNAGNDAYIGMLAAGTTRDLGMANFGTSVSINDFSTKETNQFGDATVVERIFTKNVDYDVTMRTGLVETAQSLLSSYRATPCMWIGDENRGSTIVYGFIDDFDLVLSNWTTSSLSLKIEGL